jgi:hypothetical protein
METPIQTFIELCQWDKSSFLIFSNNVFAPFLYYSHFFAIIPSLIIGLTIFLKDKKSLINNILFIIVILFSSWVFFDLILWATEKPEYTMFFWSAIILVELFIYAFCVYLISVFINKTDISLKNKLGIFLPLLPIIILLPTQFLLTGFDLTNCDRAAIQGPISTYYVYGVEIIYVLWILIFAFKKSLKAKTVDKKQILLMTIGLCIIFIKFFVRKYC